jgi:uncharacterized membrane protein
MADVTFQPDQRFAVSVLGEAMRIELDASERSFESYPTAAVYSALPYLPQALGILLARAVTDRPLMLLYAGRACNFVVATALIAIALALLPALRWFGCLVALCPMALYLRASLSPDAVALALATATAALVARLAFAGLGGSSRRHRGWLLTCAGALCLTKLPYAPLGLAATIAGDGRAAENGVAGRGKRGRDRFTAAAVVVVAAASALSLFLALRVGTLGFDDRIDPRRQVWHAASNPLSFGHLVLTDHVAHAPRYAAELIGRLGWLDTPLPLVFLGVYAGALALLAVIDGRPEITVSLRRRVGFGVLLLASAVLISAAQYASWTPVGAPEILGIQGRYFLPLMPFVGWVCLAQRASARAARWSAPVAQVAVAASGCVTLVVVGLRFWIE